MFEANNGLMAFLKTATADCHEMAESHPFERTLASGEVSKPAYAYYLSQLLHLHEALEEQIQATAANEATVKAVLGGHEYKVAYLSKDLEALRPPEPVAVAGAAVAAMNAAIAETAEQRPRGLLGYMYVLEGSTNGGKIIARAVRRAFALDGAGASYFDPYGDEQPVRWRSFKARMDAQRFAECDAREILRAAREMFEGITCIAEETLRRFEPISPAMMSESSIRGTSSQWAER
jgi:heme oxygenase